MGISLLCLEEMNMCDENMNLVAASAVWRV